MTETLGRKILGMFVETEESEAQPVAKPTVASPALTQQAASPAFDQEMLETLQKVVNGRKTPYTALVEAADRLRKVIPDDITRLKAAFATISTDGQRTLDDVIKAIDVHAADISGELMRFKQTSEAALSQKVGALRQAAQNLVSINESRNQQIVNLQQQIANLQQQIGEDTTKSADLTSQANAAESEINLVSTKFNAAADYLKNDLANKKVQLASVLNS